MSDFVKFSDIRKKRMQMCQLVNDSMAYLKGGLASTKRCTYDPSSCQYINSDYGCPFNYNCPPVSE